MIELRLDTKRLDVLSRIAERRAHAADQSAIAVSQENGRLEELRRAVVARLQKARSRSDSRLLDLRRESDVIAGHLETLVEEWRAARSAARSARRLLRNCTVYLGKGYR